MTLDPASPNLTADVVRDVVADIVADITMIWPP
jgi:hypothetical protein